MNTPPAEPKIKRTVAFFDGQNLYHASREAFGHGWPKYDPLKLAHAVCKEKGLTLRAAQFYTGKPSAADDPFWNGFWQKKLLAISRSGVKVESRELKYRDKQIDLGDGCILTRRIGDEKGIDVRIAVDVIRRTYDRDIDVALLFTQDQDLAEAVEEAKRIARAQERWFNVVSVYPASPKYRNTRGVNRTDWFPMDEGFYDACCDDHDYRS
jgi:uncharacterized LabA/DUF88 family protein